MLKCIIGHRVSPEIVKFRSHLLGTKIFKWFCIDNDPTNHMSKVLRAKFIRFCVVQGQRSGISLYNPI